MKLLARSLLPSKLEKTRTGSGSRENSDIPFTTTDSLPKEENWNKVERKKPRNKIEKEFIINRKKKQNKLPDVTVRRGNKAHKRIQQLCRYFKQHKSQRRSRSYRNKNFKNMLDAKWASLNRNSTEQWKSRRVEKCCCSGDWRGSVSPQHATKRSYIDKRPRSSYRREGTSGSHQNSSSSDQSRPHKDMGDKKNIWRHTNGIVLYTSYYSRYWTEGENGSWIGSMQNWKKVKLTRCCTCLGFGHVAMDCKGPDR